MADSTYVKLKKKSLKYDDDMIKMICNEIDDMKKENEALRLLIKGLDTRTIGMKKVDGFKLPGQL